MSLSPPIPNWTSVHILLNEVPLLFVFVSGVTLIIAAVSKDRIARVMHVCTLALLCASVMSLAVAVQSGSMAESGAAVSEPSSVLAEHKELARDALSSLALASVVFGLTLLIRRMLQLSDNSMISAILPLSFAVFFLFGTFQLVNAALHGLSLVHGDAFVSR